MDVLDYQYCYLETINVLNDNSVSDIVLTEDFVDLNNNSNQKEEQLEAVEVDEEVSSEVAALKEEIRNKEVGETFFFGMTEQDNDIENGAEPIEWIILEKKEDNAFVISK